MFTRMLNNAMFYFPFFVPTDREESSGLSGGTIVAIVIGVLFVPFLFYIRGRQKHLNESLQREVGIFETCSITFCKKETQNTEETSSTNETTQQSSNINQAYEPTESSPTENQPPNPTSGTSPYVYGNPYTNGLQSFPSTMSTPQTYSSNLPPMYHDDIYKSTTDFSELPPPPSYEIATTFPTYSNLPEINN